MYILPRIKKLAAFSLAIMLTLGAFGITKNENSVTTSAAEEQSQYAQELEVLSDKQKALEKKIADANYSIKGQQEKLNNVAEQMNVITQKIKTSEKYSTEIEDEMCLLDEQMRETQFLLSEKEEAIKTNVNEFMKRVRAMYVNGTDSYTSIIANSADFYDVLMRTELIKRVAQHDNDTITQLLKEKESIDAEKSKLEKQSEKLKSKSKEYAKQQKTLSEEYTNLLELQNTYGDSISQLESDIAPHLPFFFTKKTSEDTTEKTTTQKADNGTTTKKQNVSTTTANNNTETTTQRETVKTTTAKTTTKATTTTQAPVIDNGSDYDTKIDILMSTAKSMVGGSYVWGGTSPNATDCSGLTMQCLPVSLIKLHQRLITVPPSPIRI